MKKEWIGLLVVAVTASAQISQDAYNIDVAKAHAKLAVPELRMMMKDPGSFSLIQVIAIVKPNKKDATKPSFRGCIRYVASNSYGGRQQACGGYRVDKKGHLTVFPGSVSDYPSCLPCQIHADEVYRDVTSEAENW